MANGLDRQDVSARGVDAIPSLGHAMVVAALLRAHIMCAWSVCRATTSTFGMSLESSPSCLPTATLPRSTRSSYRARSSSPTARLRTPAPTLLNTANPSPTPATSGAFRASVSIATFLDPNISLARPTHPNLSDFSRCVRVPFPRPIPAACTEATGDGSCSMCDGYDWANGACTGALSL